MNRAATAFGLALCESVGADTQKNASEGHCLSCSFASFGVFFKVILHTSHDASEEVSFSQRQIRLQTRWGRGIGEEPMRTNMKLATQLIVIIFACLCFGWFAEAIGGTQVTISNGLVAYYPFDGNANDASGNGWDLQNDGAQLSVDRNGNNSCAYALRNGAVLHRPSSSGKSLVIGDSFTVGIWAKTDQSINFYGQSTVSISAHSNNYLISFAQAVEPHAVRLPLVRNSVISCTWNKWLRIVVSLGRGGRRDGCRRERSCRLRAYRVSYACSTRICCKHWYGMEFLRCYCF